MEERSPDRKSSAVLTAQMTNKLLDENLMQRYGTSLNINMGREYQKYLDTKYHDLKAEFDRINKNSDDVITIDEMILFLNSYTDEVNYILMNIYRQEECTTKNMQSNCSL